MRESETDIDVEPPPLLHVAPSARGAQILVVDDEATMRLMCRSVLESDGFKVIEAADGAEAVQAIEDNAPELILLDAMMPTLPGLEALARIRRLPNGQQVPVLMVTGLVDDLTINAAFEAGASDFIAKPINWAILRQRVRRAISAYRAEREVLHLAYHDTLTGLPNRRLFLERLERALVRARRYGTVVALMFIDLDGFKAVNDNFGHEAGDELLRQVAKALQLAVRSSDTVARFGGDEFNILIEDVGHSAEVRGIAEKINSTLSGSGKLQHETLLVAASIGVAIFPEDALDATNLIKCADKAMYEAKSAGTGCTKFFEEESEVRAEADATFDPAALRRMLEQGDLLYDFWQRVDLRTGKPVTGVVRLSGAAGSESLPEQLIAGFDRSGMSLPYLQHLLRSVLPTIDAGQHRAGPALALELSPLQLAAADVVEVVASELSQVGLPGSVLEICVQGLRVGGLDEAAEKHLAGLVELGCFVALRGRELGSVPVTLLSTLGVSAVHVDRATRLLAADSIERRTEWPGWVAMADVYAFTLVAGDVADINELPNLGKLGFHAAQGPFQGGGRVAYGNPEGVQV